MATCILTDSQLTDMNVVTAPHSKNSQFGRIMAAFGLASGPLPNVSDETLSRYYKYLAANMAFPFTVHYPSADKAARGSPVLLHGTGAAGPVRVPWRHIRRHLLQDRKGGIRDKLASDRAEGVSRKSQFRVD